MKDIQMLDNPPYFQELKGKDKVFNWIRKALLSSYDPDRDYGCHLKNIVGQGVSSKQELVNQILVEMKRVKQQIIETQINAEHPIPKSELVKEIKLKKIHSLDEELTADIVSPFNGGVKSIEPLRIYSNDGETRQYNLSSYHTAIVKKRDTIKKGQKLAVSDLGDLFGIGITFDVITRDGERYERELFPK